MIISDINHLEVVSESTSVAGASGIYRSYTENDYVNVNFTSQNSFNTSVNSPYTYSNSAAAGAKGDAINNTGIPSYSYTKADTLAVTALGGGSFSASSSAAVINPICY